MDAEEIERTVNKLIDLLKTNTVEEIESMSEFDSFKKGAGKMLYQMVITNTFDNSIFKEMMKMKRLIESGEDQYSVDVKFGRYMAGKFIDPVVKNIPPKK